MGMYPSCKYSGVCLRRNSDISRFRNVLFMQY
jgi:hypothetical protein